MAARTITHHLTKNVRSLSSPRNSRLFTSLINPQNTTTTTKTLPLTFNHNNTIFNFNTGYVSERITTMVRPMCSSSAWAWASASAPASAPASDSSEGSGSDLGSAAATTFTTEVQEIVRRSTECPVIIYSKSTCEESFEAIEMFMKLGVEPFVIDLDLFGDQGPLLQKLLQMLTGRGAVPNVFIGGKHIGGLEAILKLQERGELKPMVTEAVENPSPNY